MVTKNKPLIKMKEIRKQLLNNKYRGYNIIQYKIKNDLDLFMKVLY